MRRRRSVTLVQQMEMAECGVACLSMLLDYYRHCVSLPVLRELCGTSRDGNSALDLVKAARKLGMNGRGVGVRLERLDALKTPAILHWDFNHFVVLESCHKDALTVVDPANGRRRVTLTEASQSFSGVAIELTPGPEFKTQKRQSPSRARYLLVLTENWRALSFVLFSNVTQQLLAVALPVAGQVLIDHVILPRRELWFLPVMIVLTFATLAQILLQRLHGGTQAILNSAMGMRLASDMGERLLRLPLAFLESRSQGDLLERVNIQGELQQLLTRTVSAVFDVFFVLLLIGLMLIYDPILGGVSLGLTALRIGIMRWVRRPIKQRMAAELAARGRELGALAEATTAIEMVKAFGVERQLSDRYASRALERARWSIGSDRLEAGLSRVMAAVGAAMHATILWFGGRQVISGEMTIGVFSGFLAIRALLNGPMASLVGLYEGWVRVKGVIERCDDILTVPALCESGEHVSSLQGRIEARNLGFRFGNGGPWIFRNVSFTIEPGEHVAIVGPSGQGKSTLGKLICGLLQPTEGRLLIDDKEVAHYDRQDLSRRFGVVLQEPLILQAPLVDCLRLRCPDCSLEEIIEASELACLDGVVDAMPHGYDTVLAATGNNLSGGERQRVALAQALLGRPDLLLLDEATCSLDNDLEQRILQNVASLKVTTVSIAHREAVVAHARRVLEVNSGSVVELTLGPNTNVPSQPGTGVLEEATCHPG